MRLAHLSDQDVERFWSKVDRSGGPGACWPWIGGAMMHGYGRIRINGETYSSNIVALTIKLGAVPEGMCALHNCPGADNRACCNPSHLYAGTKADNVRDMIAKGAARMNIHPRGENHWTKRRPELTGKLPRGERQHCAKINDDIARSIRDRVNRGESQKSVAQSLGLSPTLVNRVVLGKTWRHVEAA